MLSHLYQNLFDLSEPVNYLTTFTRDQADKILDDRKSYSSLILLVNTLHCHPEYVNLEIFIQNRFDQVISNYLNEIFKIRADIDFQTKIKCEKADTAFERNEILAQTFTFVTRFTNEIANLSIEFCTLFVENDGLRLCLEFLRDEEFLNRNEKVKFLYKNPIDVPNYLTMIISNLAQRTCDEQKHKGKSLNAAEILLRLVKINPETQLNSYSTLAYLLDDKQIETLFDQNKMKPILDALLSLLVKASINLIENHLDRRKLEINFKGKPIKCEIHFVDQGDGSWMSADDILMSLYKLAVNESLKVAIYFDENINEYFMNILEKGNEFSFEFEKLPKKSF